MERFLKYIIPATGFSFGVSLLSFFIGNGTVRCENAKYLYFAAVIASFAYIVAKSTKKFKIFIIVLSVFLFGLLYASCYTCGIQQYGRAFADGKYHDMTVVVESSVVSKTKYSVCNVLVCTVDGTKLFIKPKIRLYLCDASIDDIFVGNTLQGIFKVEEIENTGNSNNKIIMNAKGIYFQATHFGTLDVISRDVPLAVWPQAISEKIESAYNRMFDKDIAAFYIALVRGNKDYLTEKTKVDVQNVGAAHVLAISGANVSILTSVAVLLLGKRKGMVLSIPMIIFIVLFSGATPSVMRAGLLNAIVVIADFFGKKNCSYTALGISAWIIFLLNPYAVCDVGCLLSFSATAGIIFGTHKLRIRPHIFQGRLYFLGLLEKAAIGIGTTSVSAILATFPICCFCFGKMSVLSIITNIIICPLMTLLFVMSFIIGIFGIYEIELPMTSFFAENCVTYILECINKIAKIPFMATEIRYIGLVFATLAAYLIFAVYMTGKSNIRFIHSTILTIALVLLAVIVSITEMYMFTTVKVFNLNCVCLYIQDRNQSFLINCGNINDDYAVWSIYNNLSSVNVTDKHTLVITKVDYKHAGAAETLIQTGLFDKVIITCETKDVNDITLYYKILNAARKNDLKIYLGVSEMKCGNIEIKSIVTDDEKSLCAVNANGYNVLLAYGCGEEAVKKYTENPSIKTDMLFTDLETANSQTVNRLKSTRKLEFVMIPDYIRNEKEFEPSRDIDLMLSGNLCARIKCKYCFFYK